MAGGHHHPFLSFYSNSKIMLYLSVYLTLHSGGASDSLLAGLSPLQGSFNNLNKGFQSPGNRTGRCRSQNLTGRVAGNWHFAYSNRISCRLRGPSRISLSSCSKFSIGSLRTSWCRGDPCYRSCTQIRFRLQNLICQCEVARMKSSIQE